MGYALEDESGLRGQLESKLRSVNFEYQIDFDDNAYCS